LGRFLRVGRRSSYPLQLLDTQSQSQGRVLLMGNAARTVHPVAGQGLNLALRDMAALAERLLAAAREGGDLGEEALLAGFVESRRRDQRDRRFGDDLFNSFCSRGSGAGCGFVGGGSAATAAASAGETDDGFGWTVASLVVVA